MWPELEVPKENFWITQAIKLHLWVRFLTTTFLPRANLIPTPGLRRKGNCCKLLPKEKSHRESSSELGVVLPSALAARVRGVSMASRVAPRDVIPLPFSCLYPFALFKNHIPLRTQGEIFQTLGGGGDCGTFVIVSQHLPWVLAHSLGA